MRTPAAVAALVAALSAALLVASAPPAAAQQAPGIVAISLTPATITVGDRLSLVIDVEHDAAFTVEGPGFGENYGTLELIEVREPRGQSQGALTRTTLEYTLTSFSTGTVTLPPLNIRWRGPAGEGSLATAEQTVEVVSVLDPGEQELRPLKPQLDLPEEAPSPLLPALYVAMFAALTAFGYVLVARAVNARPPPPATPLAPPATAAERARAALDGLASDEDLRRQPLLFYGTLAAIVRRYLTDRYGVPAYAMTRRELQRAMSTAGLGRWPARVTGNLLEQCDAVQFARFIPAPARMDADLTAAYEIVDLTSPAEPPPEAEPVPAH